jgi:hypothetical protein
LLSKPAFAACNMEIISAFAVRQMKKTCRSDPSESNTRICYELFTKEHRSISRYPKLRPLVLPIIVSLKMSTIHWELVAGVSPRRNRFGTQPVQVGFVRDEVALGHVLQYSFVGIKCSTS